MSTARRGARGPRGARGARARRAAGAALAAFASFAGPARARRRARVLGVLGAETCTWAPDAAGGTVELFGVQLSQVFSEAPRRGAAEAADAAELAAAFVTRKPRRRKNVALTAWSLGAAAGAASSPVYLVGALAGAEAGAGGASLRLRLEQAPAQARASRPPPAGGGAPPGARSCSVFLDPWTTQLGPGGEIPPAPFSHPWDVPSPYRDWERRRRWRAAERAPPRLPLTSVSEIKRGDRSHSAKVCFVDRLFLWVSDSSPPASVSCERSERPAPRAAPRDFP